MNSTAPNCQDIVLPWFFESISLEVPIYGRRETKLVAFSMFLRTGGEHE